jgi:predicted nucleic acid-binding protein
VTKPRPIVVIDTSVFLKDALSPTHRGAASQILAILPAIATIVMCDEIRQEILEKFSEILGWTEKQVLTTYGPVLEAAIWVLPVPEQPWHRKVVHDDDDTMLVRTAEAVFTEAPDRIEAAQLRFVVSENKKHLKPGTSYASFLCVTSHGLLEAIE